MILSNEEYVFIEAIQKRFPEKKILENFKKLLETSPENRRDFADKKLQELPRKGYIRRGIPVSEAETVFEHIEDMAELAIEVTPSELSLNTVVAIVRVHDIGEAIIEDFTPHDDISSEEKNLLEFLAVKIISESDPEILEHWLDFEEGRTPEGLFVQDLDKLQMYRKSVQYGHSYPDVNLTDILSGVEQRTPWSTPAGEKLFSAMRMAGPRMPFAVRQTLKPN